MTRGWAAAVSAVWRPVFSIPWLHWGCQAAAMASATTTACSSKTSSTAGRWSHRTTGWSTVTREFERHKTRYTVRFGGRMFNMRAKTRAGWKQKRIIAVAYDQIIRVMKPMPPTPCACGAPRPAAKLTSVNLIRGLFRRRWKIKTIPKTFPGYFIRTTRPIPGVSCAPASGSISLFRRRCRIFFSPLPVVSNL